MVTAIPCPDVTQLLWLCRLFFALVDGADAAALTKHQCLWAPEQTVESAWTAVAYLDPFEDRLPHGLDPGLVPLDGPAEAQAVVRALVQAVDHVYVRNRLLTAAQQRHAWRAFDGVFGAAAAPDAAEPPVPRRPPTFPFGPDARLLFEGFALAAPLPEALARATLLRRTAVAGALCDPALAAAAAAAADPAPDDGPSPGAGAVATAPAPAPPPTPLTTEDLPNALHYVLYTAPLDPPLHDDALLRARLQWLQAAAEEAQARGWAAAAPPLHRAIAAAQALSTGLPNRILRRVRAARADAAPREAREAFLRWSLLLDALPEGPLDLGPHQGQAARTDKERQRYRELGPIVAAVQALLPPALQLPLGVATGSLRRLADCLMALCGTLLPLPDAADALKAGVLRGGGAVSHVLGPAGDDGTDMRFLIAWRFAAKALAAACADLGPHLSAADAEGVAALQRQWGTLEALVHQHFNITQSAKAVLWKRHRPPAAASAADAPDLAGLPSALQSHMVTSEEDEARRARAGRGAAAQDLLHPLFSLQSKAEELQVLGTATAVTADRLRGAPGTGFAAADAVMRLRDRLAKVGAFGGKHGLQTSIGPGALAGLDRLLERVAGGGGGAGLPQALHAVWLSWHERSWGEATGGRQRGSILKGSAVQAGITGKLSDLFTRLKAAAAADCVTAAAAAAAPKAPKAAAAAPAKAPAKVTATAAANAPPAAAGPPPAIDDKLRSLILYLYQYHTPDIPGYDWTYLLAAWQLTVLAFAGCVPGPAREGLYAAVVALCRAVQPPEEGAEAADAGALRARLQTALRQCDDLRWQQTLHTHALPLVDCLVLGAGPGGADLLGHAVRGRAWTLLGEWRLLLLVPASPVDPILRNAEKRRRADAACERVRATVRVFAEADQFARGKTGGAGAEAAAPAPQNVEVGLVSELHGEDAAVLHLWQARYAEEVAEQRRLSAKPVHRHERREGPQHNFVQLYNELHAFVATQVTSGKCGRLASGLMESFPALMGLQVLGTPGGQAVFFLVTAFATVAKFALVECIPSFGRSCIPSSRSVCPSYFFICSPTCSVPLSFVPLRPFPRHDEAIIFASYSSRCKGTGCMFISNVSCGGWPRSHSFFSWCSCIAQGSRVCTLRVSQEQKVCIP